MCLINAVESTQLLVVDFNKSQLEILKLNCALNRILLPPYRLRTFKSVRLSGCGLLIMIEIADQIY